ncbi:pyridoxal phosphate-dependent transferase [Bombardia bombarda]|uniref:Pyridoxal phosphate-dependent transferase n=1 Tax=Bombardia bombarda TaxID=252184 RepID=A0AA39XL66_9PEZI|nr:pyridoxal phosphate-dependent transferase [Bombardia bombarda]
MKDIPEFNLNRWSQRRQHEIKIPLHGSAVRPLSLAELQILAPDASLSSPVDHQLVLAYSKAQGSLKLRERIAEIHSGSAVKLTADNVIITPGSILANYLALAILAGPGDHVICQYPTFTQLWAIPKFQGVEVSLWKLKPGDNGWEASLDELKGLVRENTKAIIIKCVITLHPGATHPSSFILMMINNTTATQTTPPAPSSPPPPSSPSCPSPRSTTPHHALLRRGLCPALPRPSPSPSSTTPVPVATPTPPSIVSLPYPHTLATGSVSKAIGLPGIRIGWVISPSTAVLNRIMTARDYTTISVSLLDEGVAAFALAPGVLPALLARNLAICGRSIALLQAWVDGHSKGTGSGRVAWVPPQGAGTAFVRVFEKGGRGGRWMRRCLRRGW